MARSVGKDLAPTTDALRREVDEANLDRATAHAVAAADQQRRAGIARLLDPQRRPVHGEPTPSREEILLAIAEETDVERRCAESELRARQADRRAEAVGEKLKAAMNAELEPRKREAVRGLAAALLGVRPYVDALQAIEDEESAIAGNQTERLSAAWCSIGSGAPCFEPLLDTWTRYLRGLGFDIAS